MNVTVQQKASISSPLHTKRPASSTLKIHNGVAPVGKNPVKPIAPTILRAKAALLGDSIQSDIAQILIIIAGAFAADYVGKKYI